MPTMVATAAIESGLPPASVKPLIMALAGGDIHALNTIPGVTPAISAAAFLALEKAYLASIHCVWYAACPFAAVGVIGKHDTPGDLKSGGPVADTSQSVVVHPKPKIRFEQQSGCACCSGREASRVGCARLRQCPPKRQI